jgi:hypothetical protein
MYWVIDNISRRVPINYYINLKQITWEKDKIILTSDRRQDRWWSLTNPHPEKCETLCDDIFHSNIIQDEKITNTGNIKPYFGTNFLLQKG